MYNTKSAFFDINPYIKMLVFLLAALSLFLPNTILSIYALLSLVLIIHLTWIKGHLPIVTVCLLFQWAQAVAKIVQATYQNQSISYYTNSHFANEAIFLSITGILVVGLGFRLIINKKVRQQNIFDSQIYDEKKAFKLFIILFVISHISAIATSFVPALAQITLSISNLQWVGYSILFITCLRSKKNYRYLVIAFMIEMASNLFGFFSNFREVILFTIILYVPFQKKITLPNTMIGGVIFYFVYIFFVSWTGIKNDFRNVLSNDENISYSKRVLTFYDLYNNFESFEEAEENSLDRLAYTDMLMYCLETIPRVKPHENGTLWLGALQHILMPRFLFPDKKVLNDSDKANLYTGREWASADQGTSISIGYVAESYVDFGYFFMFIPLFLLGTFIGLLYKIVSKLKTESIFFFSIISSILFFTKFSLLETSGDKLLGALVMNFIALYTFGYFYSYRLQKFISVSK